MNRKILLVDDSRTALGAMTKALEDGYDVHTASSGGEAIRACEESGPFAVVLSDYEMPEMNGIQLLTQVEQSWPDTTRMMLTGHANLDLAIEALRSGSVFRFLSKSTESEDLRKDVQAGVERFKNLEEERLLTEQLQFSRESLLSLTETLERRLADQLGRLRGMQQFTSQLNETESLEQVAELTADTTFRLFGRRPVEVEFNGMGVGKSICSTCGDAVSEHVHSESVVTTEGYVGCIRVEEKSVNGRSLASSDRSFLASLAASAAIAAYNQIHRLERDSAQHATIFALARLAEFRDDETGKHLERVSKYCGLIARGLREDGKHTNVITDGYVYDLEMSAPLHDIGKVGVPDSILHKPGKLTEEEWVIMRKHSAIGAETLRNVLETSGEQSFLRMGHEIAWCHHERWSGGGYPRGLSGEEIPLAARVMALADCYDALTTRRPYKGPWTHDEASAYILEQRGIHFDPDVVDAFERRAEEVDDIRRRLGDGPIDPAESLPDVA